MDIPLLHVHEQFRIYTYVRVITQTTYALILMFIALQGYCVQVSIDKQMCID